MYLTDCGLSEHLLLGAGVVLLQCPGAEEADQHGESSGHLDASGDQIVWWLANNDLMVQNMALYGEDALVTHKWDKLQRDFRCINLFLCFVTFCFLLRCCGGMHYEYGYIDWANVPSMRKRDVPDSCCHNIDEGCGRDKLAISVK